MIKGLQEKFNTFKRQMDPETIEKEKKAERRKGIVKGFAVGSVIAGITALFLSPDSGKNNREKAKKELDKAKDILGTGIEDGKKKLAQVYEDTKEVIKEKRDALTEKPEPGYDMNVLDENFEILKEDSEETGEDLEEIED
ncbi:MAG TPA: YtxH domain-containing protein [Anaerovoracaceae bacterium]|nr:YtxH domain-containing protein [Anaerovoracaceae bacterium]